MVSKVFFLVFLLHGVHAPQSYLHISQSGTEFIPLDDTILLLDTLMLLTYQACFHTCHQTDLCRVFDYDALSHRCRLFEGDLITTGLIGLSNSPTSAVGHLHILPFLFKEYGRPCNECIGSRYLECNNSICACRERTYWTGSICASQHLYAGKCSSVDQCRSNLNHTCLQFLQCGPVSLHAGTTVFGNANGSAGSSNTTLDRPWGISVAPDGSLLIADPFNRRVIVTQQDFSVPTSIIGTTQLQGPCYAMYDATMTHLYVLDSGANQMMRYSNGSNLGITLFGSSGSALNQTSGANGFTMDSRENFYIADSGNHRILFWSMGASKGRVVAGTSGISGSGLSKLNLPTDVALDEANEFMYVCDNRNHRILRFKFNSTNGTVVAGGNGQGIGRHQLNGPISITLCKKSNALYIADKDNNRVQLWYLNDNEGVTIAGSPTGVAGTTAFTLNIVNHIALNANETRLFISDRNNSRIQRFQLI